MRGRTALTLAVLGILIVGALALTAVALPSVCPSGFHGSGTICVSNATHVAPSSGIRIPLEARSRDPRLALRWAIGLTGLIVGAGLVAGSALGRGKRRKQAALAG